MRLILWSQSRYFIRGSTLFKVTVTRQWPVRNRLCRSGNGWAGQPYPSLPVMISVFGHLPTELSLLSQPRQLLFISASSNYSLPTPRSLAWFPVSREPRELLASEIHTPVHRPSFDPRSRSLTGKVISEANAERPLSVESDPHSEL